MPDQNLNKDEAVVDAADDIKADESLVPEGWPTPNQIEQWHEDYPHSEIIGYPFMKLYIVYRSYTISEQEELMTARAAIEKEKQSQFTEDDAEKLILERFVLWPNDFIKKLENKQLPAGIPTMISANITASSGYVDIQPEVL